MRCVHVLAHTLGCTLLTKYSSCHRVYCDTKPCAQCSDLYQLYAPKVFELIRISVEKELQRLNHNLFFYTDPGPSQNRPRSAPPKPSRGPDYHSRIAATAQKSFDDCCSSVSSGEGEGGDSSGTEPDVDGDPVNESFSSSSHSISIPVSVSVRASMSNVHPSHDTGAPQSQSELVLQSAPHARPMARDSAPPRPLRLPRTPSEAAIPSLTPTTPSTCTPTTTPTGAFVAEELKRLRTLQVSSSPSLPPPSPLHPTVFHSIPSYPS